MPKDGKQYSIELEAEKVEFLEQIVSRHGLRDLGKAVRCLVNYARENPDKHADIFDEVRCLDC
jgi:predicted O-methyltransferase YrrM